MGQVLEIVQPDEPLHIGSPPETLLLNVLPYKTLNETDAQWVTAVMSGWDDLVDMMRFCSPGAGCTQYADKAVMYHVNPGVGSANLRCGHYVTYIQQEQHWYLADDSIVARVLMPGMRGLPYLVGVGEGRRSGPVADTSDAPG